MRHSRGWTSNKIQYQYTVTSHVNVDSSRNITGLYLPFLWRCEMTNAYLRRQSEVNNNVTGIVTDWCWPSAHLSEGLSASSHSGLQKTGTSQSKTIGARLVMQYGLATCLGPPEEVTGSQYLQVEVSTAPSWGPESGAPVVGRQHLWELSHTTNHPGATSSRTLCTVSHLTSPQDASSPLFYLLNFLRKNNYLMSTGLLSLQRIFNTSHFALPPP